MEFDERTVIARSPLILLDYAEQRGLRREDVMSAAGLSVDSLTDIARQLTQADVIPTNVELPLPRPESITPYTAFFGIVPRFDCPLKPNYFSMQYDRIWSSSMSK